MSCISLVSFALLINVGTSHLFQSKRGLHQGFPLSPLLFLLVTKGLSYFLKSTSLSRGFKGFSISWDLFLTHLIFVDDILIFYDGSRRDVLKLFQGLVLLKRSSGMKINEEKSNITCANLETMEIAYIISRIPFQVLELNDGLKYIGFYLKPSDHRKLDWMWLLAKLEKRLKIWSHG